MKTRKLSRAARPVSDFHVQIGDEMLAAPDRRINAFVNGQFEFRMPPQPATDNAEIIDTPHACARVAMDWHYRNNLKIPTGAAHVNQPMFADFWKVAKDSRQRSMRVYGRAMEYAESAEGIAALDAEREKAAAAAKVKADQAKARIEKQAAAAEKKAADLAEQQSKLTAKLNAINAQIEAGNKAASTDSKATAKAKATATAKATAKDTAAAPKKNSGKS